nr:MFS transporter [Acinetobacter larvae]
MFAGLTVSNVIGVPFGTFIGLKLGWHTTFWVLAVIGVVTMVGIRTMIPTIYVNRDTNLIREYAVFNRPQVWISALLSILSFSGVIGGFTYIAFILTQVSGFSVQAVPWLLIWCRYFHW